MALVPAPRTWTGTDSPTAAMLNTEIRDTANFLLAPPRAVLMRAASLSLANDTPVSIPWDTEILDTANGWASSPNPTRYTVQYAGKYRVSIVLSVQGHAGGGGRFAYIRANGTEEWQVASMPAIASAAADTIITASLTLPYTFAVNEYIEVRAEQTAGATLNLSGASGNDSYCTIEWLGS
jgi:hypothetical protein